MKKAIIMMIVVFALVVWPFRAVAGEQIKRYWARMREQ